MVTDLISGCAEGLCLEFQPAKDDFAIARSQGVKKWIVRHLLHGINKYFVLFWGLFILISTVFSNYTNILVGNAVDFLIVKDRGKFAFAALLILLIGVGAPVISLCANFMRELVAQRLERDTRHEFYTNLLGKSLSFHDRQRLGDLMAQATNDVRLLNYLVSPALTLIAESMINIFIPIIFILLFYPMVLVVEPLIFTILFIWSLKLFLKRLAPIAYRAREEFGSLNAILNESMAGIEVVKGSVAEDHAFQQYSESAAKYRDYYIEQTKIEAKYVPVIIVAITITAGILHSILLYEEGLMSVGEIIGYIGLLITLQFPTNISVWAFGTVQQAISGSERMIKTLNQQSEIGESQAAINQPISGKVEFRNVGFIYPGSQKRVLNNISFTVGAGETIAIVGTTGSGKTSLTKLITRLYDVSEGEILVDGVNVKNHALKSLRNAISYIEQDVFLFSNTVAENIAFGRIATIEEIRAVAQQAQADEFIMRLPHQYKTEVGERGVQLSGGERQRIAIARAFLADPKILILDDSTSAIDSKTEEEIQKAIRNVLKGRTTFLITHRLSQIRWADKILVLKRGQIEAFGTHTELLKTSEEYRKIFTSRFEKSVDELLSKGGSE